MRITVFPAALVLAASVAVTGCTKPQEQCDPRDSAAVCKQVQQCFRSGTSIEVCREGEKDANAIESNKSKP
jgi:hypothetical protein